MEKTKKKKNYLIQGPIPPEKLATMTRNHQQKTGVGAHTFFLGQIREDEIDGKTVSGIEYSAHEEMANKVIAEIREEAFEKFDLHCLHVAHSLGMVKVGEVSLVVMVSSAHRGPVFPSLEFLVEQIKKRVPIWKKEFFTDGSHRWIDGQTPSES